MTAKKGTGAPKESRDARPLDAKGPTAPAAFDPASIREASAEGTVMVGTDGRRYYDAIGGYGTYNLGRANPELRTALSDALTLADQGNFTMISVQKTDLAEALAAFVPGPLEVSLFGVTRGESMDAACKVARGATGRRKLLTVGGGWYGQTGFAVSLSDRADAELYGPLVPDVARIPFNEEAALAAVDRETAAVFLEPLQAENHCRSVRPSWLAALRRRCDEVGALLALDETQTGFGRCGVRFLCENAGVAPDILLVGEALGGGVFPIVATMLTQEVNAFLNRHPMLHLSTFGGHDAGCIVARRALQLYEERQPWRNAAQRGAQLDAGLSALQRKYPEVALDIAGKGLLWSIGFADAAAAQRFVAVAAALRHPLDGFDGLLAATGRVATETVVLRPSLLITYEETLTLLQLVEAALERMTSDIQKRDLA